VAAWAFATRQRSAYRARLTRELVAQMVRRLGLHLLLEPGRTNHGPGGDSADARAVYKENGGKTFVVVDAAMNDLMRPALYGAIHPITAATRASDGVIDRRGVDLVGPVCETGDWFFAGLALGARRRLAMCWEFGRWGIRNGAKRPN